ncbi:MAG: LysM domain-containing protein [Tateyamaria sp.]|uniref:LysM peptidoglycan-binding domain-containing protein n=1 Tax=Tateyamaria sp. TaxID=1929288 RepID=UPI00329BB2B2
MKTVLPQVIIKKHVEFALAGSNLDALLSKEYATLESEAGNRLTVHLQSSKIQKQADDLTSQSTPKPPKQVVALFENALAKEAKTVARSAGLPFVHTLKYKREKTSWKATVTSKVKLKMASAGGSSYTVKPGDTLWAIAKNTYGSGLYWTDIEKANGSQTKSKGNHILAGAVLKLPKIQVPVGVASLPSVQKAKAPKPATKTACKVAVPGWKFDFAKIKPKAHTLNLGMFALKLKPEINGTVTAYQDCDFTGTIDLKKLEAELAAKVADFTASITLDGMTSKQVSLSVGGKHFGAAIKIDRKKLTVAWAIKVKTSMKIGKATFEIDVELAFTGQFIPRVKETIEVLHRELIIFLDAHGKAMVVIVVVIVVAGIVVILIKSAVLVPAMAMGALLLSFTKAQADFDKKALEKL